MGQAREGSKLLRTAGDSAGWHVSLLVPEEQRLNTLYVAYGRQAILEQAQRIVRFVGDHVAYTSSNTLRCYPRPQGRSTYGITGTGVGQ